MTRQEWDILNSTMGYSSEQDTSIRESVRQAVANGATVPAGYQNLLMGAGSWMPGKEQYSIFNDPAYGEVGTPEDPGFGYEGIDSASTDVLSQFAPSIADPTNKMTETTVKTKDADGNETTITKKGKFDKNAAEAREYASNLTMPRMIDGSNSLLFPQSMVATAREGTPQEIANRDYNLWEAEMKGQGQVMDSQGSYQPMTTDSTYFGIPGERDGPMALNTRSLGTSYPGGALQDPSIFNPLGTSYSGSPTQANYGSLMAERKARAAELENMKNAQIMAHGFKSGDAQNMAQGFREADAQGMAQGFISADLEKEARAAELENMKNSQIMAHGFKSGDAQRMAQGFKEGDAQNMAQGFREKDSIDRYNQAVNEATSGMEDVPASVFDDFRNSEEYKRGTAGQNYKEMMDIDDSIPTNASLKGNYYEDDIALKGDASIFDEENFGDMDWGGTEGTWSEEDAKQINENPAALASMDEFKKRIDANPETKQEEYIQFLKSIDHLQEWRPQLFKSLLSGAISLVAGGDAYQAVVDSLGYQGEEAEKIRLEEREDDKDILKLLMEHPGMSEASLNATLKELGVSRSQYNKFKALFSGARSAYDKEADIDAAKLRHAERVRVSEKNAGILRSALGEKSYILEPQLEQIYNELDGMPGLDYGDSGIQAAIKRAIKQGVEQFNKGDDDGEHVNLLGFFWENILLSTSSGTIGGDDTEDTTGPEHARLVRWIYTQPQGSRKKALSGLYSEWVSINKGEPDNWYGKKNFVAWANKNIQERKKYNAQFK